MLWLTLSKLRHSPRRNFALLELQSSILQSVPDIFQNDFRICLPFFVILLDRFYLGLEGLQLLVVILQNLAGRYILALVGCGETGGWGR